MKKPGNLSYGVNEKPPLRENLILGLQHMSIFFVSICMPVLLIAYMGNAVDERTAQGFVSLSMISGGLVTIIQSLRKGSVGSGYLVPSVCGPSYLSASMMAVSAGGLPVLFGMTGFVGLVEVLFSRIMHRLRFLFPPEVTGTIVLMVGVVVIPLTMESFVGIGESDNLVTAAEVITGFLTLGLMVGINVFSKGKMRLYGVLIGIIFGYALAGIFGIFGAKDFDQMAETSFFALPYIKGFGWQIDFTLMIPFTIATLSSTLKTVGDITTVQKINDADWKRTDMKTVSGGIFADGLGGIIPGLIGGYGQSTSSANIGLSIATGATSRGISWSIGGFLIILAFLPKVSEFFLLMPLPVIGATLIYSVSFMIIAGLQIIMSRMLDARKTFVVGISLIFGLSVYVIGDVYQDIHSWIRPVFSSSLSLATVSAVVLNLLLRIGVKKHIQLELPLSGFTDKIFDTMEKQGGAWGARREVIYKASAAMNEIMEVLALGGLVKHESVQLMVKFDEFSLNSSIHYDGEKMEIPDRRPDPDQLLEDPSSQFRLAAFLACSYADSITTGISNGKQEIRLHFEH